ncbi:hypothetical protein B0H11DRAFT_1932893 [Mycena galericulata]|nr:hypothetical protein B0H11DRAFT_1932893 [Mycena galericulata]
MTKLGGAETVFSVGKLTLLCIDATLKMRVELFGTLCMYCMKWGGWDKLPSEWVPRMGAGYMCNLPGSGGCANCSQFHEGVFNSSYNLKVIGGGVIVPGNWRDRHDWDMEYACESNIAPTLQMQVLTDQEYILGPDPPQARLFFQLAVSDATLSHLRWRVVAGGSGNPIHVQDQSVYAMTLMLISAALFIRHSKIGIEDIPEKKKIVQCE